MTPISDKVYAHDDIVKFGRMKPKTVGELIEQDRRKIFEMIKKGYLFTNEVLKDARITKTERDHRTFLQIAEHAPAEKKVYAKDTASLKTILCSLNMDVADINMPDAEYNENFEPLDTCEE